MWEHQDHVEAARRVGIRTRSSAVDTVMDAVAAAGTGALTSFVVGGWIGLGVSMAAWLVGRKKNIGARLNRILLERPRRIAQMAEFAGQVSCRYE